PASVVKRVAGQSAADKATLESIVKFLTTGDVNRQKMTWDKWFTLIRHLKFPTATLPGSEAEDLRQSASSTERREQIAHLMLMDFRRQQLEWDRQYGKSIEASLQWIYLLQRP